MQFKKGFMEEMVNIEYKRLVRDLKKSNPNPKKQGRFMFISGLVLFVYNAQYSNIILLNQTFF